MDSFFYLKIKSTYNINRMEINRMETKIKTFHYLGALLKDNKIVKGSTFTHTCMKGGAYYIKSEDMDQFYKLYTND